MDLWGGAAPLCRAMDEAEAQVGVPSSCVACGETSSGGYLGGQGLAPEQHRLCIQCVAGHIAQSFCRRRPLRVAEKETGTEEGGNSPAVP